MQFKTISIFVLAIAVLLVVNSSSIAEDNQTVLVVVNGVEITTDQVSSIAGANKQVDLETLSDAKKKELIESLITRQLILEEAHKEGFDQSEKIVATVKALADSYIVKQYLVKVAVGFDFSDAVLKKVYEEKYMNRPEQFQVSHILLKTEAEAQAMLVLLNSGSDFTNLAQTKSQDKVSAQKGGDLGWLTSDDMVPTFFKAVSTLTKGETTAQPLKTKFGWHILKLVDKRELAPPPFDEVKQKVRQELIREKITDYIENLKAKATIEIK